MNSLLATLGISTPESLKRVLASVFGTVFLVFVNPFLNAKGLPPVSDETLLAAAGVIATFVFQSGANSIIQKQAEAKVAAAAAAAAVKTVDDANKALETAP